SAAQAQPITRPQRRMGDSRIPRLRARMRPAIADTSRGSGLSSTPGVFMAMSYPTLPSQPTRAHVARLLWRAGFSGSTTQITRYAKMGLAAAISELLNPFTSNILSGTAPTDSGGPLDPVNHWGHDCLWWLDRMVRSRNQLQERMTLNLHDLFATS